MIVLPVQTLVVDDSAVVRGLLVRALENDPQIQVVGTAMHGAAALTALRRQPVDVVILDVEMPVMDGLTALPLILQEFPRTRVIMASAQTTGGAEATIKALAAGAAGCIAKPIASSTIQSIEQLTRELVPLVKSLGAASYPRPDAGNETASGTTADSHGGSHAPLPAGAVRETGSFAPVSGRKRLFNAPPPSILVIGTSTGGPNALSILVSQLPASFSIPILIVQHMPPLFTPMLAKRLQQDGKRPCQEATQGGLIERGHTYVAPGDFHMLIDKQGDRMVTVLNQAPPEHYCRPSVNPLFRTAAEWYSSSVLAVMLTGMGDDGIEGTRDIVARGGRVITQDEASSVVWGMPGAVARERLADEVLPLNRIAPAILKLCGQEVCC